MSKILLHEIMSLVDKNSSLIPEGDYLELCEKVRDLYKEIERPVRILRYDEDEDDDMVEMGSPIAGVGWEDEVD
jgi:hypothetical protein